MQVAKCWVKSPKEGLMEAISTLEKLMVKAYQAKRIKQKQKGINQNKKAKKPTIYRQKAHYTQAKSPLPRQKAHYTGKKPSKTWFRKRKKKF